MDTGGPGVAGAGAPEAPGCLVCGGATTPVAHGSPLPETLEAAESGDVVLGGCVMDAGQPTDVCRTCGARAGRTAPLDLRGR